MGSPIDSAGEVKTSKNDSQYTKLDPSPTSKGELGTGNKTSTGIPEGSKGKWFKGRGK